MRLFAVPLLLLIVALWWGRGVLRAPLVSRLLAEGAT